MAISFGSYTFPTTFYPSTDTRDSRVVVAELPRSAGGVALPGKRASKKIAIQGGFVKNDGGIAAVGTALDSLISALDAGAADLSLDGVRHWRGALKSSTAISYEPTWFPDIATIAIEFICPDPYQYSSAASTQTVAISSTDQTAVMATGGGNVSALPQITLTLTSAAPIALTITNNTTGEQFTLAGTPVNTTIVVDCLARTVVDGAGGDAMFLFEGLFPQMETGTGDTWRFQYDNTKAAHASSFAFSWQQRWS